MQRKKKRRKTKQLMLLIWHEQSTYVGKKMGNEHANIFKILQRLKMSYIQLNKSFKMQKKKINFGYEKQPK